MKRLIQISVLAALSTASADVRLPEFNQVDNVSNRVSNIQKMLDAVVTDDDATNAAKAVSSKLYAPADWIAVTNGESMTALKRDITATQQVQADWDVTDTTSKAYIQNKPTIVPIAGGSYTGEVDVVDLEENSKLQLRAKRIDVSVTNEEARVKVKNTTTETAVSIVAGDPDAYLSMSGNGGGLDIYNTGKIATSTGEEITIPTDKSGTLALTSDVPSTYLKSATSSANSITVTKQDNTTVGLEVQYDYALTNLTAETLTLRSGEIGNYTTASDFTLTLSFDDNGRSGDCMLYVANTDSSAEHTITPDPAPAYTYVSADLVKALTLGKATTNIVSFTCVKSGTVLVSKLEVK